LWRPPPAGGRRSTGAADGRGGSTGCDERWSGGIAAAGVDPPRGTLRLVTVPTAEVAPTSTSEGPIVVAPRQHRRVALLLAVLLVALVGLALALSSGTIGSTPRKVAVVGDSITNQSATALTEELGRHGYHASVSGINGAGIAQMTPALVSAVSPGGGADVVVAALGTNNAFFAAMDDQRHEPLDRSRADLDTAVRQLTDGPDDHAYAPSARCVVWVNVNDHTPVLDLPTNGARMNEAIAARLDAERAKGRDVVLVDFASASRDQSGWFLPDGIHLTPTGQQAYARLIRQGVDRCR